LPPERSQLSRASPGTCLPTGNITNPELGRILVPNLPAIVAAFDVASFLEISRAGVIVHE
jgi:predicted nuclease of predicted toxin-antitoxin system